MRPLLTNTGVSCGSASTFGTRPVVLAFAYYDCPMLCTLVLNGLTSALNVISLEPGTDFELVTISFDPRDTPAAAAAKKASYLERYKRPGAAAGWHFLTGGQASIDRVTQAAGFRYVWDADTRQFAHPTGIVVLTPDGRLARYLFGVEYGPRDLRFAIVEASAGKVGTPVDSLLLYCYHYDPMTGRYGLIVMRALRVAGAATVLALGAFIVVMVRREKRRTRFESRIPNRIPNPESRSLECSPPLCGPEPLYSPSARPRWPAASTPCTSFFSRFRRSSRFSSPGSSSTTRSSTAAARPTPSATVVHGGVVLEIAWTVIPFIISMVIFVWGASVFFAMSRPPDETLNVYVVGKQWMWKFQHLDGQREINELHVPVGRAVKLIMTSEDVIHDVFVPAFRVKADVLPGRYTNIWFQPTKPGRYHLFCAEYCGTRHSGMIGEVVVMEPSEYQAWLSGGAAEGSLASAGEKLFADLACNTCHRPDAQGRGPVLQGLFGKTVTLQTGDTVVVDEAYVRESILNPSAKVTAGFQPIMPTFQGLVSEEQLLELIEYVKALR